MCHDMGIIMSREKELLAQPEGITPREGLTEYKKGYAKAEQDLKRKPLSGEAIDLYCKNKDIKALERLRFYHGVLFAEKEHGIGGGK